MWRVPSRQAPGRATGAVPGKRPADRARGSDMHLSTIMHRAI
ncbi:hypothetical protein HMPREF0731_4537 [Pseudoroseomonas cervicalis ATCC 49957]|uniref:Uncharacterized protein n=1 Tax=Pseudoroseomonas cervicalis ATCC 49957 TaxID=525371 RepID=D5RTX5_9PROT|nr:hypothetical protein HMPREF0731_4537 [Pseudoroseomonas cervicalis ATCC 49957]